MERERERERSMERHFVLVHGSCHGGWCWYRVAAMLKSIGHKVSAPDLAASGRNMKQLNQVRSISDYSQPLIEFMSALPPEERVILVGHSMGGLSTTIVIEKFPHKIAAAVFLAAFMPGPNLPFLEIAQELGGYLGRDFFMDSEYTYDQGPENPPTSVLLGPKFAAARVYHRSPAEDLILGSLMMRPGPLFNNPESLNGLSTTEKNYGTVRRVYIRCTDDPTMRDVERLMIEKNRPDDVRILDGADHMPMFSKASEVCSYLIEAAKKYS